MSLLIDHLKLAVILRLRIYLFSAIRSYALALVTNRRSWPALSFCRAEKLNPYLRPILIKCKYSSSVFLEIPTFWAASVSEYLTKRVSSPWVVQTPL